MSSATTTFPIQREPELLGQTVVVIGGGADVGLERPGAHAQRGPS